MKNLIYILSLSVIISSVSYQPITADIVTDGLVSYWTFDIGHIVDITAKDVWGDNNGIISGNPKVVSGYVGEALEFDGSNDFVNLTALGEFGRKMGTITFEAWIKTKNKTDWMTLINTHGVECPYWGIQLNGLKNQHGLQISEGMMFGLNSIIRERGCSDYFLGGSYNIYDGKWHHIIFINENMIEEGKGFDSIYVDTIFGGVIKSSLGNEWTFFPFTEPVYLGARNFGGKPEGYFDGMIDEVRFYDRRLSEEEIIQNFESTTPYNVEPKGKLSTVWGTLKTIY